MTILCEDLTTPHCIVEREEKFLIVTLNRPEAKNAISSSMLIGMYRAWRHLDENDALLCAILTGKGSTFCAGMDLKKGTETTEEDTEIRELMKTIPDIHWQALLRHNLPSKPILMAVEGYAVAGGTEILQGTDIRVAAEDAVFGITEVTRGLFPLGGSTIRLRRQIPYALAAEMLLLGRHISAQEAKTFGLVNRLVPKGEALTETKKIARELCKNGPLSIKAITKSLRINEPAIPEKDALEKELEIGWPIFGSQDAKEGMRAFKEKREPIYQGK